MTPPEATNRLGLTSVGIFTDDSPESEQIRQRLAETGMRWFHECQNQRVKQERQWYYNLAFYYGNQYVQFKQSANGSFDLYVPRAPYYRARIVVNQIRKVVRKEIARLTAQKPNAFVVPASSEDADVFAAQAGEQIWSSLWRRLSFDKVLREAVFWQTVCGTGYVKSYWDKTKLDKDSDLDGDICVDVVTPFHLFVPDLLVTDIEDQPYIIHAQVKTNAWVEHNFHIKTDSHKLESVDEAMLNVMGINRNDKKNDQTIVLEIWVKPNYLADLPNGGMFLIAANQVVQGFDSWPYEHSEYPISKLDSVATGKFYTSSIVEDLIPLQQELNRSRSQLIESKNRMSKPQLVAEEGAVNPKRITTEPGQVIEYKIGFQPPQPLALQNLPSYVTEEINRLYSDISDISGQHEVSNGSTPPGVTAATAISFLQEQDESLIANHFDSIEELVQKVARQSLCYVKMFWDEERTVKIVGLDGTFDVQTFRNSDLKDNTDIRVEAGSSLPTSRAAKQAFIMDLMKMGFIKPEEGLEILEVGGLNRIYERVKVDKRQAVRENLKMRVVTEDDMKAHAEEWKLSNPEVQRDPDSGLMLEPPLLVPVNTYDNHQVHIEEHNNYRKSQAFEGVDPAVKVIFEEHVKQHIEAMSGMMAHPLANVPPGEDPGVMEPGSEDMNPESEAMPGPEAMPELEGGMD
jgi:hypothetical protein